jgi:hypothetical protein
MEEDVEELFGFIHIRIYHALSIVCPGLFLWDSDERVMEETRSDKV